MAAKGRAVSIRCCDESWQRFACDMPTLIQISGTITSAEGNGSSTIAAVGSGFTATITTDGLGGDMSASNETGFFALQSPSISLQLTGGTITTNSGTFVVLNPVSGSDSLHLAASTPIQWDGKSVGTLGFDFSSGHVGLFASDQQTLDALTSDGFAAHRWLSFSVTSASTWNYQGNVTSVSVSAIPEPAEYGALLAVTVALVAIPGRFRGFLRRARLW